MKKITLTYIGTDDWSRPVFQTETGEILKDLNLGEGKIDLCTAGSFDGEPNTPIRYIEKYKQVEFEIIGMEGLPTPEEKFNYQMLSRLQSDCEYFLNYGNRNESRLWAGNVAAQIEKMKELYHWFDDDKKPEWLTLEDISAYSKRMTEG